jgi:hypothetical protein
MAPIFTGCDDAGVEVAVVVTVGVAAGVAVTVVIAVEVAVDVAVGNSVVGSSLPLPPQAASKIGSIKLKTVNATNNRFI